MYKKYEPYTNEMDDGRVKLSTPQKTAIRDKYETGNFSQMELANEFGVSRSRISLIVNLELANKVKTYQKGRWKLYYDTVKSREAARKTRSRKKLLQVKGV